MTDDDIPEEDIDAIDVQRTPQAPTGPSLLSPGLLGAPTPVFAPSRSTPLEEEDDASAGLPRAALWAMKYRRHIHFGSRNGDAFRASLGDDGDPVHILDDGPNHYMVCREVGVDDQSLKYFLIGRITVGAYERFTDEDEDIIGIFSEGNDLCLCSVYEAPEGVSNVLLVESYRGIDDVPMDYLPSNPLIHFSDDLPAESDL